MKRKFENHTQNLRDDWNEEKYDEISKYFYDWLNDQDDEWEEQNIDNIHNYAFNENYFMIGTYRCEQWLGDQAFKVIGIIKNYEQDNFGQVNTDLSDPEKIVNMFAYIVGEQICDQYKWEEHGLIM
jgi:hypothetical protein